MRCLSSWSLRLRGSLCKAPVCGVDRVGALEPQLFPRHESCLRLYEMRWSCHFLKQLGLSHLENSRHKFLRGASAWSQIGFLASRCDMEASAGTGSHHMPLRTHSDNCLHVSADHLHRCWGQDWPPKPPNRAAQKNIRALCSYVFLCGFLWLHFGGCFC